MDSFCEVVLVGNENGLSHLHLQTGEGKRVFEISEDWIRNDLFFEKTVRQIEEYFRGRRIHFDLRLNPDGTDFQKSVWAELCRIPYGATCSYKDVAQKIGNPGASRAVGMANSRNPIPLIIPCHRVVGAGGSLTGFAHGLNIKRKLLDLEARHIKSGNEQLSLHYL